MTRFLSGPFCAQNLGAPDAETINSETGSEEQGRDVLRDVPRLAPAAIEEL